MTTLADALLCCGESQKRKAYKHGQLGWGRSGIDTKPIFIFYPQTAGCETQKQASE